MRVGKVINRLGHPMSIRFDILHLTYRFRVGRELVRFCGVRHLGSLAAWREHLEPYDLKVGERIGWLTWEITNA